MEEMKTYYDEARVHLKLIDQILINAQKPKSSKEQLATNITLISDMVECLEDLLGKLDKHYKKKSKFS